VRTKSGRVPLAETARHVCSQCGGRCWRHRRSRLVCLCSPSHCTKDGGRPSVGGDVDLLNDARVISSTDGVNGHGRGSITGSQDPRRFCGCSNETNSLPGELVVRVVLATGHAPGGSGVCGATFRFGQVRMGDFNTVRRLQRCPITASHGSGRGSARKPDDERAGVAPDAGRGRRQTDCAPTPPLREMAIGT
jgi:hypothetical protein